MHLQIWTDGSKALYPKDNGGWAFIMTVPGTNWVVEKAGFMPHTTNNRAEMTAILKGLEILSRLPKSQQKSITDVTIFSDSQYSIGAFTKWKVRIKTKNRDLIAQYKQLVTEVIPPVTCKWIRGHTGLHKFNTRADKLANEIRHKTLARNRID